MVSIPLRSLFHNGLVYKWTILICSLFFLLGFITCIGIFQWKISKTEEMVIQNQPTPTPVILAPPKNARVGNIATMSGVVKRIPWNLPDATPASLSGEIYQGDELITEEKSYIHLMLPSYLTISIFENSDVMLGSLLPDRITIQLQTGSVSYQLENGVPYPISIRVAGSLYEIASGSGQITMEKGVGTIRVTTGQGKLASVNSANNTELYELNAHDSARIEGKSGDIETSGELIGTQ